MNNPRIILHLLIGLLVLAPAVRADDGAPAGRTLALEDWSSISDPRSPRISPDGERIAFVVDKQIHVVGTDGNAPRTLTAAQGESWQPRWSADGDSLYFLSDRGGKTQVWTLSVRDFGEATQLSDFEHGIESINLSPDESQLLLELSDVDLEQEDDEKKPQPIVVTRRQFKEDAGDGYITEGESSHLYVYDIRAGTLRQLTSGEFEEDQAAWSPDGRHVVFVSNRDNPDVTYGNDLWVVASDNTDNGGLLTRLTNNPDTKQSPAWSPDGDYIAYITAVDGVYGLQHIAVVPASGGEPRVITAGLDRWVNSFEISGDGGWIWFSYDDASAIRLARVRVRDGRIEKLVDGDRAVSDFDVGEGGAVAMLLSEGVNTPDIFHLAGRRVTRLTDLNRELFDEVMRGDKFLVSFDSTDATVIESFITTPPGYEPGRAYPAILRIHGGPVWQFSWGFDFASQYFASRGYVVIEPNPRGSTGRDQDFINAIYRAWGIADYDDVMAAVDYAIERGIADPARLAVTGYSYGGYMTNMIITRTNRFGAAASGAGHSLIAANFGHDMYQQWYMWELGPPWENREGYDAMSPLLRVTSVETPTIFLGGRIDWNVPVLNAELFYQALQVRGIDTELVVYPDTHHGGWSEEFDKDYIRRVADWFDKYLAGDRVQTEIKQ